jgi:hypothetical protein
VFCRSLVESLQAKVDTVRQHQVATAAALDALLALILDQTFKGGNFKAFAVWEGHR